MRELRIAVKKGNGVYMQGDREAMILLADGERLSLALWYDTALAPLRLHAPARVGDTACLYLTACRVALYVNGVLWDEEWPRGNPLFPEGCTHTGEMAFVLSEDAAEPERPLRRGLTTEQWRLPGVNVGDCMPFSTEEGGDAGKQDGLYHLFYLYDRHHHQSKWWLGAHQWAHVATKDLVHWEEFPMAVGITEPWEGSICTGSILAAEGKYYAFYAVRMPDGAPARLTMAVSDDLLHFRKTERYFTLPAAYEGVSARDPKVVYAEGKFHMFVTTTLLSENRGCLAHLCADRPSADGADWVDLGGIVTKETPGQPECADYFRMGDYYYLIYSPDGRGRYLFSPSPLGEGGWTAPEDNVIPCGKVPKSALLHGRRIFTGFEEEGEGYAGHPVFAEALQNPDGTLHFVAL